MNRNGRGPAWTREQKDMLFTDMSNEQIAVLIHKTPTAVKKMRYYVTGYSVALKDGFELARKAELERQGIAHVIETAHRIGAKILDID
ncbi:MAG: hypothetical protein IKI46_01955 [Lachnospiraceae bacterium]|nr:hypothetical protein [Clostridia bacterium]MBR7089244.1 hypothetical protein [Lachnospiraceae bacterium]